MTDILRDSDALKQEFSQDIQKAKDRNVLVEAHKLVESQRSYIACLRIYLQEKKKNLEPSITQAVIENRFVAEMALTGSEANKMYEMLQQVQNLDVIQAQLNTNSENVRALSKETAEYKVTRVLRRNENIQ